MEGFDGEGDGFALAEGVVLVLDREWAVVPGGPERLDEAGPEGDPVGVASADGDVVPGAFGRALVGDGFEPGCDGDAVFDAGVFGVDVVDRAVQCARSGAKEIRIIMPPQKQ